MIKAFPLDVHFINSHISLISPDDVLNKIELRKIDVGLSWNFKGLKQSSLSSWTIKFTTT